MARTPRRPAVTIRQKNFARIPAPTVPRSTFNRSCSRLTTHNEGYLIPVFWDWCVPGDTINFRASIVTRIATLLHPIHTNVYVDFHLWSCPARVLWHNFVKMCGEQDDPGDSTSYNFPTVDTNGVTGAVEDDLYDYMEVPLGVTNLTINSMWLRMYNLVFKEFYRDEDLQNSPVINTDDGADTDSDYALVRRGKRHDYFTSCRPWPQKGTAVTLPLGTDAPITGMGKINTTFNQTGVTARETDGNTPTYANASTIDAAGNDGYYVEEDPNNNDFPNIRADLTNATAATINSIREAFALQKLLERDARGGTRYVEHVLSHFGVQTEDARAQRPEYIGGYSFPINIITNPVMSKFTGSTPGQLTAWGLGGDISRPLIKSFTEHQCVLGLLSVRADLHYQQGLSRFLTMSERDEMYYPALAMLGEQEVLNKEIYCDGTSNDDDAFGYQERWAEYRYKPSSVTGQFRSTAATPLDSWHLAQEFASLPTLGNTFIQETPPIDRVAAVASEPHFISDCYFQYLHTRPMPTFSVPGLIDHF